VEFVLQSVGVLRRKTVVVQENERPHRQCIESLMPHFVAGAHGWEPSNPKCKVLYRAFPVRITYFIRLVVRTPEKKILHLAATDALDVRRRSAVGTDCALGVGVCCAVDWCIIGPVDTKVLHVCLPTHNHSDKRAAQCGGCDLHT